MLIRRHTSDEEQWAPVSDLMAVTMLIFMLIAMILLVDFGLDKANKINNRNNCEITKSMLNSEFKDDFEEWGAVLEDDDLTIRFTNQRVLFAVNSAKIEKGGWFANMLEDFFPRYMKVIADILDKFGEKEILAIRIDGHTSSEYKDAVNEDDAYIKNMELSQDRARNILGYVLDLPQAREYRNNAYNLITANGLSFSKLIRDENGNEDKEASRRVEFKLLTNSCQKGAL